MAGELETLFDDIKAWQADGQRVALATVVHAWGSAPRGVGSHLAVNENGAFSGSVSAGCVEGAVIEQALAIIGGEPARRLDFDVADADALDVGLACGGRIAVHIESLAGHRRQLFDRVIVNRSRKQPVAMVTRLSDGAQALLEHNGELDDRAALLDTGTIRVGVEQALHAGRSVLLPRGDGDLFVRIYPCDARLLLVGAVHIAQILAPMALQAGFEPLVIDPRRAYATPERFGNIALYTEWPDAALQKLGITSADAVVALTHDPKLDDPALAVALRSPAFYIGALGSRRSHAKRLERLAEIDPGAVLERIHGPVGLPLGGRAPAEIAVSILAHLIARKYAA